MSGQESFEQMCRDLLAIAIREGLVTPSSNFADPDPQIRTSGELAGMANLLTELIEQCKGVR